VDDDVDDSYKVVNRMTVSYLEAGSVNPFMIQTLSYSTIVRLHWDTESDNYSTKFLQIVFFSHSF
jgi:hypothetical protein